MDKLDIADIFEQISPILVNPKETSVTISLSKRFFLFQMLGELTKKIEEDPYLNFISILKYYKAFGDLLHGTIHELYRDRNSPYFRDFFAEYKLYRHVKADLEEVYRQNKEIRITITKSGIIIYDNYKTNHFNLLLLTMHSGTWMPLNIQNKQSISAEERFLEEDVAIDRIYRSLVLKNSGIWIDNKMSRFACDYNRRRINAIYKDESEKWLGRVWKKTLTSQEKEWLLKGYDVFYFYLNHLIDTHRFNMVFDGHSMKDAPKRAEISFGTRFVPKFYLPIVENLKKQLCRKNCFCAVKYNAPFSGGHILERLSNKFPDIFILSLEVNKKLYMNSVRTKIKEIKLNSLSKQIFSVFGNF
ncbi:MAG: N-formylglutamate amidohydrolase [archaeon]